MTTKSGSEWLQSEERRRRDIGFALKLLPLVAPLGTLAAAGIMATELTTPIFRQERSAGGGATFTILKLRTMPLGTPDTKSNGHYDARATRLGKLLRISRLDETPQLIHIFRGEMTSIGPRPLIPKQEEAIYEALPAGMRDDWWQARQSCKRGIVDPYGLRKLLDKTADDDMVRAKSDIWYAENASEEVDRKLLGDVRKFYGCLILGSGAVENQSKNYEPAVEYLD